MCLEKGKYIRNASTLPSAPQISEDAPGLGIAGCESVREQRGEGLKAVRSFRRYLRACAHRAAAYVEENEGRDDERVDANAALLYVRVQQGSLVEGEVAAAGKKKTANHQRNHADKTSALSKSASRL